MSDTGGVDGIRVIAGSADCLDVAGLLAHAVGGDHARFDQVVDRYRDSPTLRLLVAVAGEQPVGVLGYELAHTEAVVLHIATAPFRRRTGIGTSLLNALRRLIPAGVPISAETDNEAVGFYRSSGFRIESLGEKYPGVERFRVTLGSLNT